MSSNHLPPPPPPSVSIPTSLPLRPLPIPPLPVSSPPRLPPRNASTSTPHWHLINPEPLPASSNNGPALPPLPPRRPTRNPNRKIPPLPELASTQPALPPALPPRVDRPIAQPILSAEPSVTDAIEARDISSGSQQGADDLVGELPSYDRLKEQAERSGDSRDSQRFGRWKGWIEKRAGERHLDEQHALEDQLAENRRRSNLGWGAGNYVPRSGSDPLLPAETEAAFFTSPAPLSNSQAHESSSQLPSLTEVLTAHPSVQSIMTTATVGHAAPSSSIVPAPVSLLAPVPLTPTQAVYKPLGQSRFLPHLPSSSSAPQCLFPLGAASSSLLLVGTKEGLWVFDPAKGEPARGVFGGAGVRQMKAVGRDQIVMLCHSLAGDGKSEVRVWDWNHLTDMAMWISGSTDPPSPFNFPLSPTSSSSSLFKSSVPSSSSSTASSLSVSVPQPLRTLAGALHTQHANVPLLNIHHSISGSIKRRVQSSHHHDHDDGISEFTVQSDDVPEFPPRSESLSPYPDGAGSETDGASSQGKSGTGSDHQAKDFQLLNLPVGMLDPGLIEVWTDDDETLQRQSLVAVSGKGTVCVYRKTEELELAVFREFYLPPQPKPLSALSFITYSSILPISLSSPSLAEPSLSSLALFFNFTGGKTCLIDLDSARLIDLDWPTSSTSSLSPKITMTTLNGPTNTTTTAQTSPGRAQRDFLADEWEATKERWSAKGKNRARGRSFSASTEGPTESSPIPSSAVIDNTLGGGGGGSVKAFVGSVLGSVRNSTTSGVGTGGGSKWIGGIEQVWSNKNSKTRGFCLLTKAKETCVWPIPLPVPLPPAIHTFAWPYPPSSISSYLSFSLSQDGISTEVLTVGAVYSSFLSHQVTIDCQSVDIDLNPISAAHGQPSPTSSSSSSPPTARSEVVRRAMKDLGQQGGLFELSYPVCCQVQPETQIRWGWDYRGSDDWRFFELRTNS